MKFHDILGTLAEHDWIQRNFANSASSRTWVSLNGNASWFKLITHQQFDAAVEAPRGERRKKPWIVNGGSALPHVQRALPAFNLAGECRSRLDVGGAASLRDHLRLRRHDDSPTRQLALYSRMLREVSLFSEGPAFFLHLRVDPDSVSFLSRPLSLPFLSFKSEALFVSNAQDVW